MENISIKDSLSKIKSAAEILFGGEVSVDYSYVDGKEDIMVQSFIESDGVMEEVHYARFNGFKDALSYYAEKLSGGRIKSDINTKVKDNNFGIVQSENGEFYLDGYENAPVHVTDDIKREYKATVVGYYPDETFNESNGKIYLRVVLDIPMTVEPNTEWIKDKITGVNTKQFASKSIRKLIIGLRNLLRATSSKINTNLGTNMSIYELVLGENKIERV